MDDTETINEISRLLKKVQTAEDLVQRAEAFYLEHRDEWREEIAMYFLDLLERKKEQIHYEWHRIGTLGDSLAAGMERCMWTGDDI